MNFISITNWFGGRSTFFALAFLVVGVILTFMGKLTTQYIGLAASVQTLLVTRAVMDDYHERCSK